MTSPLRISARSPRLGYWNLKCSLGLNLLYLGDSEKSLQFICRQLLLPSFLFMCILCWLLYFITNKNQYASSVYVSNSAFFFKFIFGCAGSSLLQGLFSGFGERGPLSSWGMWASHCGGPFCCRTGAVGNASFSSCNRRAQYLWLPGSRAQAQPLWYRGSVATQLVGSSWIWDGTCVFCIGRQILHHWATREALLVQF